MRPGHRSPESRPAGFALVVVALLATSTACSSGKVPKVVVERPTAAERALRTERVEQQVGLRKTKEHAPQAAANLDGAVLYAQNCAACHGPLETSKKQNATAAEIAAGIARIPQMAALSKLTPTQLEKIAVALQKGIALAGTKGANPFQCVPAAGDAGPAVPIRRLTRSELQAVYRDLFGKYLDAGTLKEIADSLPEEGSDGVFDNKAATKTYGNVFSTYKAATLASRGLAASSAFRGDFGGCSTTDDACAAKVIGGASPRILRRAVPAAEAARYVALAKDAGGGESGLAASLLALLVSPPFLHRMELGGAPDKNGVRALDAYELASRLSFVATGTLPDAVLWAKAVDGSLLTDAVFRAQVERLTSTEAFKDRVALFTEQLSGINARSHTYTAPFLSGLDGSIVINQANQEFRDFVKDGVFASRFGYRDFVTSGKVVPMGNQVASIYLADLAGNAAQAPAQAPVAAQGNRGLPSQSWLIAQFELGAAPSGRRP